MLKSAIKSVKAKLQGGFTTKRRIVVIESDDWGSIRMSSNEAYNLLLKKGYNVDTCAYNKLDILESDDDVHELTRLLSKIKGQTSKTPIITLNNCTANPNFEKIKESNFKEYFWEPFTETYNKYPNSNNVVRLIKKGIEDGFFQVQYHGREHLNIPRWMNALEQNNKAVRDAFDVGVFSPKLPKDLGYRMEYMDALDYDSVGEKNTKEFILKSGYQVFKDVWGQGSTSFIAPCYRWDENVESVMKGLGVNYIQGQRKHSVPIPQKGYELDLKFHFTGEKNMLGQVYMVRNVFFEPSMDNDFDWVTKAYKEVKTAFLWREPAIISMHRINFVGGLSKENRDRNLQLLRTLLTMVIEKFPDVEFMSSDELGDIIKGS